MTTPLFPLGNALFPDGVLHLRIFEVRYLDLVRRSVAEGTPFGIVPLLAGREVRTPEGHETLASHGTLATIEAHDTPMPGLMNIRCRGGARFRLIDPRQLKHGLWMGEIELLDDAPVQPVDAALQDAADALGRLIADLQKQGMPAAAMPIAPPFRLDESGWVADRWAELLPLAPESKQDLLAQADPLERLRAVHAELARRGVLS